MINVLQIIGDYYGSNVYKNLFHSLEEKGEAYSKVIVPLDSNTIKNIELDDSVTNVIDIKRQKLDAFKSANDIVLEIEKNIDLKRIDIIHAHSIKDGLVAYAINKKHSIPYLISMCGSDYKNPLSKTPYNRRIVKTILSKASKIIFVNNSSKETISKQIDEIEIYNPDYSPSIYQDVYKEIYDGVKDKKKKINREYHSNPKLHPIYDTIKKYCEKYNVNEKTKKCLDVGSGRGHFQELANDYTGLEPNQGLSKYYRKPFVCAKADNMPFQDGEFDITWSVWALEHIENIEESLKEMMRVTKNGGHIILAPAWRVKPWVANGYRVRPYSDFDIKGKIYKFFIPLLNSKAIQIPTIIINRIKVYFLAKKYKENMSLQYKKLNANYGAFWESDSNACNSIDQYALIKWFESRGCICVSHKSPIRKFLSKGQSIDIMNVKNAKKVITYGDIKTGIHLRINLEMFESLDMVCQCVDMDKLLYFNLHNYDVLYLNWYENIDKNNIVSALAMYISKRIILKRTKHSGLKILYTKHNKLPHNTKYLFLIKKLYKKCFDYADQIICFTKESADDIKELYPKESYEEKINIINPVNYVGTLPIKDDSKISDLLEPYKGKMIITLFGWIREYKNPLLLIDVANEFQDKNIVFVINGVVKDQQLKETIENKAKGLNNIILNLERIDDADLHELINRTTIFVTPYDTDNASNSGVGRLAFSYGKTVITSNIASMNVIPKDLIYIYDYKDECDHFNKLKDNINTVYDIWLNNPEILDKQGEKLKELMNDKYSFDSIKEEYMKVFNKLF